MERPGDGVDPTKAAGSAALPLTDLVEQRYSRRDLLRQGAFALLASAVPIALAERASSARPAKLSSLTFPELRNEIPPTHQVARGYRADVLIRWGDPVLPGAPAFDPHALTAEGQARQFGYNNDFIGYAPLPRGSRSSTHGLLCVNHEFTDRHLMWPGVQYGQRLAPPRVAVEMAAHGHSVLEVKKTPKGWRVVPGSAYARRITPSTPMKLSGPAAGHERLKTQADPTGTRVLGTLYNCAGGVTPWGTVLIAEENFQHYFVGSPKGLKEERNYNRLRMTGLVPYRWGDRIPRFHLGKEPNEPNRFGWIVEFDPYDPESVPIKRTALGRFKHEGAACVRNRCGRVVLYSGDDEPFEYIYKFLSKEPCDPSDPGANRNVLDQGTLFVARAEASGKLHWMPLVFGTGPLTPKNDFHSQADVLIETRRAADLLGATPMDRPEDVEANPVTGRVYAMLTSNPLRTTEQIGPGNPRAQNLHGHILELTPPNKDGAPDHTADTFRWDVFILAGNPKRAEDRAQYHRGTTRNGWFSSPDNLTFDPKGRLWIATDQGYKQAFTKIPDGLPPALRPMARRCSSPCSTREETGARRSKPPRPAGPTSTTRCRRAPRWS
ncbi:MAG: PhoX family protein [Planctomycetota bacterium]